MTRFLLAAVAGWGAFLLWTAAVHGWSGLRIGPPPTTRTRQRRPWPSPRLAATSASAALVGLAAGASCFGPSLPALLTAVLASALPVTAARHRDAARTDQLAETWPRLIDEIRILTASAGRSIPHALFEAAGRGPEHFADAFAPANRRWLLSADFGSVVRELKDVLADHTADIVLETLLIAYEVGGADVDARLSALAEDRRRALGVRRAATAEQAGVQFARRFVLVVPFGMALAGAAIGPGRASYQEASSQVAAVVALVIVAACWAWSGHIMRIPPARRVLAR